MTTFYAAVELSGLKSRTPRAHSGVRDAHSVIVNYESYCNTFVLIVTAYAYL